jgi:hypothetical protein
MEGRACHAVELSPAYVDVAVLRWQAFTGQQAVLAATLFTMATVDKNVAAVIFWMKARGGWREKQPVDTDKDANEPTTVVIYRWATDRDNSSAAATPTPTNLSGAPKRLVRDAEHD